MASSAMTYFDRAMNRLRDLGLVPEQGEEAPIVALLNRLTALDEANVTAIARTMSQASLFNEVVREQVSSMKLGERYDDITDAFNSIRDDAKGMVEQLEDGKVDTFERIGNIWMKATRGDIASRFDKIKDIYLAVATDSRDQIERERTILEAYQDFRGALKESEILSLGVLEKAEAHWNAAKEEVGKASEAVAAFAGDDLAERARLELARDEKVRELQDDEDRYQIAKDLSDN
ncbi:MAG: cell surface protein, partial [Gammaproteobacteria bacterium]|nr:cell surface protein [Gammaproteobacteria bacterium]